MSLVQRLPIASDPPRRHEGLAALWGRTLPLQFSRGDYLYLPGDPARSVFLVRSGSVRIARLLDAGRELTLDVAGPGELVGDDALVEAQRRTLAQALTPLRIAPLPVAALTLSVARDPALGLELARQALRRESRLGARATLDALGECRQRVAALLLELAERYPEEQTDGVAIGVRLTHEEIGRFVGAARETVTPLLVELRRQGAIDYDRRRVLLRDANALRALSRGRTSRRASA